MIQFRLATLVRIFVLTAFLVTAVQSSASAADKRDFSIVNNADKAIHHVYCTPHNNPRWAGSDVLGKQVIMQGDSHKFVFNSVKINDRYWDLRIVFSDGHNSSWQNIDLYAVNQIIIYKNGNKYAAKYK